MRVDLDAKRIEYDTSIEKDRQISFSTEELCRAFLVAWLCEKGGYTPEHLYLEKRYSIGRPGGTSAFGDILIRKTENGYHPYLLIEVKSPEEYDEDDDEKPSQKYRSRMTMHPKWTKPK